MVMKVSIWNMVDKRSTPHPSPFFKRVERDINRNIIYVEEKDEKKQENEEKKKQR